ncbi:MAG TPA: glutamate-cysteine ligase family protein [Casimicrobiaceae bacterium]|nr:glutamate-cysteine ligase family protein [Casimicrobiaceae bacterium]
MTARFALPAFAGYGIELEYMIVDRRSLAVRPIADQLLRALAGRDTPEVERGTLGWSNELVRHVVEVKNIVPTSSLVELPARFHDEIRAANERLAAVDARLMPTAMHPWMDPATDTVLWEDAGEIYRTYDRIYDCCGHGWSNLQSMHVNLPFAGDAEFERLHAAIRLVLPLVPALAASSPFEDGRSKGFLDRRLENYRTICTLTPSVSGRVIPDTSHSRADYEARVLAPMYAEIAALDQTGVLQHEWLNSRGAIPRFDRDAIEIRLVDVQECPQADLAIAAVLVATVRALYRESSSSLADQQAIATETLYDILLATMRDGDDGIVDDAAYLRTLGVSGASLRAGDLWRELVDASGDGTIGAWWRPAIDMILSRGPLARRILRATGSNADRDRLHAVYRELCDCLAEGRMFA